MTDRRRRGLRALLPIPLALFVALGVLAAPVAVDEVRAAAPDLTIVGVAKYTVRPADRLVRVTVDLTLTNHLKDTVTKRFYFDRAYLAVMPGSSGFNVGWDGAGAPSVRVTKTTKDYRVIRIDLAKRLYGGKTAVLKLRFDLVDPGGKPTRDIRVGDSLVSFPVWAFASDETPGGSATVVFPKGYSVTVAAGAIPDPTTDAAGRMIFRTGSLSKPLSFFAYLIGDRPGAYTQRTVQPTIGGRRTTVTIRSWPDDRAWDKRVGGLVAKALPLLADDIGLPWPRADDLVVQEAVSRSTNGYAGIFDPTRGLIEVAYYAKDDVALHEAAHAWFNGGLLADRWANEAFASYYGLSVAKALKVKVTGQALTPAMTAARIPLNAWEAVGREPTSTEDYAYAASLGLARAIAERAGDDGLRKVWAAASAETGAYQPPTPDAAGPERVSGPPDWRGLLDLLEDGTGVAFDDLWRTWVARDEDLPLLDARAAARTRYADVLTAAGDWALPRPIRDALRAWQFEDASALLDQAAEALVQRTAVQAAAAKVDLIAPATLRAAFEDADGFDDSMGEAAAELRTIERYAAAAAARPATTDVFITLGLWNETPEADLSRAATAFRAGDLAASASAADLAAAVWSGAEDLGRGRALSLIGLALAALLALGLIVTWIRGRDRRRRVRVMQAHRLPIDPHRKG